MAIGRPVRQQELDVHRQLETCHRSQPQTGCGWNLSAAVSARFRRVSEIREVAKSLHCPARLGPCTVKFRFFPEQDFS